MEHCSQYSSLFGLVLKEGEVTSSTSSTRLQYIFLTKTRLQYNISPFTYILLVLSSTVKVVMGLN